MKNVIETIFNTFNKEFFNSSLHIPNIEIDATKKYILRYEASLKTLKIGTKVLSCTSPNFICYMLHEMIHIYNYENNLNDVNENQYHNLYFANKALDCGLAIAKYRSQGWSETYIDSKLNSESRCFESKNIYLKQLIEKMNITENMFDEIKEEVSYALDDLKPTKNYALKYICGCPAPYNSIRCGRRPNGNRPPSAICTYCNSRYYCVSKL